ncbi:hypothetical protein BH11MYX4_BH11MYX4_61820 [soil metagenome]
MQEGTIVATPWEPHGLGTASEGPADNPEDHAMTRPDTPVSKGAASHAPQ